RAPLTACPALIEPVQGGQRPLGISRRQRFADLIGLPDPWPPRKPFIGKNFCTSPTENPSVPTGSGCVPIANRSCANESECSFASIKTCPAPVEVAEKVIGLPPSRRAYAVIGWKAA